MLLIYYNPENKQKNILDTILLAKTPTFINSSFSRHHFLEEKDATSLVAQNKLQPEQGILQYHNNYTVNML